MPTISVIVPVYDVEKYLRCCLDSILAQTYTDIEVLLVDDGSNDSSGAICDEYAELDSRVRVFHKTNGGVSSARNLGLDEATGRWIMFVDSDDKVSPEICELLLEHASEGCMSICDCFEWYESELRKVYPSKVKKEYSIKEFDELKVWLFSPWAKLFDRMVILEKELYFLEELSYGEDRIFCNFYLEFIDKIVVVDEPLYYYRMLPNSLSKGRFIMEFEKATYLYYKSRMDLAVKKSANDEKFCVNHYKNYFLDMYNAFENNMREDAPGTLYQKIRRNSNLLRSDEFKKTYPYRNAWPQYFGKRYIFMLELSYHTGSYFWLWMLGIPGKIKRFLAGKK